MSTQRVEGHTPTLLPCPFCGGTDIVIANKQEFEEERDWDDGYRTYICDASNGHSGCGGSSGFMPSEELARESWNRRASIERLEKVNKKLTQTLGDLLEQIDCLDGIEYSKDLDRYKAEAVWDDVLNSAQEALKLAKESA